MSDNLKGKARHDWESALLASTAKPSEKHMLRALLGYAGGKPACWPSVGRLAAETGLGQRQVQRIIKALAEGPVVVVEDGSKRTHRVFIFPSHPAAGPILAEYGAASNVGGGVTSATPLNVGAGVTSGVGAGVTFSVGGGVTPATPEPLILESPRGKLSVSQSVDGRTDVFPSGAGGEDGGKPLHLYGAVYSVIERLGHLPESFRAAVDDPSLWGPMESAGVIPTCVVLKRIDGTARRGKLDAGAPERYLAAALARIKADPNDRVKASENGFVQGCIAGSIPKKFERQDDGRYMPWRKPGPTFHRAAPDEILPLPLERRPGAEAYLYHVAPENSPFLKPRPNHPPLAPTPTDPTEIYHPKKVARMEAAKRQEAARRMALSAADSDDAAEAG